MMHYRYSYDMTDPDSGALLAQLDVRAEIFGLRGKWFRGEIEVVDLDTGEWCALIPGSRLHSKMSRQLMERRSAIDLEWAAHVDMHGEDGLLDATEMRHRHAYEARP